MSDCISREALIARFDKVDMDDTPYCQAIQYGIKIAKDWTLNAPAVTPEVRHGRWVATDHTCALLRKYIDDNDSEVNNYSEDRDLLQQGTEMPRDRK